jgi:hypothetical protein
VFDEVLAGSYIAQALVPPSSRTLRVGEAPVELKLDLRNYVYAGHVQLIAARLWQGQTTNFRTPGGGFAPVLTVPSAEAARMKVFGLAGWSGSGKTTLLEELIPRLTAAGSARLADQARPPPLRHRPSGQGFLPPARGRLLRGAADLGPALGTDARTARRARALAG